jgi:steroid delta-isomerase-like uncharacterized protein
MHRNEFDCRRAPRKGSARRLTSLIAASMFVALVTNTVAADMDEAAINARAIREHHDLLNKGDWRNASLDFSEDTKNFGRPVGRAVVARILEDVWQTFPDYKLEIVQLIAQGDTVIVRCKTAGTHKGVGKLPVNGGLLVGVPPTGKHFEVETVHFYTLRDGKIVDHRGVRDDLAMMVQLGLISAPKPFDWADFARHAVDSH